MNDAFELSKAGAVFSLSALCVQLLNRLIETTQFVTTIGEWGLREDNEGEQDQ